MTRQYAARDETPWSPDAVLLCLDVVRVLPGCGARRPWMWCALFWLGSLWCLDLAILCFVFFVLCFVFCVLCFVFCVLCFVFCVFRVLCRPLLGVGKWWANYSHIDLSLAKDRTLSAHHWPSTRVFLPVIPDCFFLFAVCSVLSVCVAAAGRYPYAG